MKRSLTDLRRRIAQKNAARPQQPIEQPLRVHHAHCAAFCYLRFEPPPANGVGRFTREQYLDMIGEMQRVLKSFDDQAKGAPNGR